MHDEPESLPRRQTDPAWLQDHFLGKGHDEKTRNATATFVKRHGRLYAVTCRHVVDALKDSKVVSGARHPTIALYVGKSILNLSSFTAQGMVLGVESPKAETKYEEIDVAIAPLDGHYWQLFARNKRKMPIDLDAWQEPDWSKVTCCLVAGYPDEHKQRVSADAGEAVASQLVTAVAKVSSRLGRSERLIALSSVLDRPHGFFFSGMSGGPVYAIEGCETREFEDGELFPVGIIFEGFPGSGRADAQTSTSAMSAFMTDQDLFFRALTLTPEIFDQWLKEI